MNQPPNQPQSHEAAVHGPMSVVDWLVTLLILSIPCLGIVMLFIWSFSGNTNPSKQTFARAYLVWTAIIVVISLIASFVFGAAMAIMLESLMMGF